MTAFKKASLVSRYVLKGSPGRRRPRRAITCGECDILECYAKMSRFGQQMLAEIAEGFVVDFAGQRRRRDKIGGA